VANKASPCHPPLPGWQTKRPLATTLPTGQKRRQGVANKASPCHPLPSSAACSRRQCKPKPRQRRIWFTFGYDSVPRRPSAAGNVNQNPGKERGKGGKQSVPLPPCHPLPGWQTKRPLATTLATKRPLANGPKKEARGGKQSVPLPSPCHPLPSRKPVQRT